MRLPRPPPVSPRAPWPSPGSKSWVPGPGPAWALLLVPPSRYVLVMSNGPGSQSWVPILPGSQCQVPSPRSRSCFWVLQVPVLGHGPGSRSSPRSPARIFARISHLIMQPRKPCDPCVHARAHVHECSCARGRAHVLLEPLPMPLPPPRKRALQPPLPRLRWGGAARTCTDARANATLSDTSACTLQFVSMVFLGMCVKAIAKGTMRVHNRPF